MGGAPCLVQCYAGLTGKWGTDVPSASARSVPIGDTLAVCPPLIITEAEIDEVFDRFERGLDRAETMVAAEDLRNQ